MTRKNFVKSLMGLTVAPLIAAAPVKTYRSLMVEVGNAEELRGLYRVLITYRDTARLISGTTYVYNPADIGRCREEHEARNGTEGEYYESSNFVDIKGTVYTLIYLRG